MKPVNFIITNCSNHIDINNNGSGASEMLFFNTAVHLARHFDITIYYAGDTCVRDNIKYVHFNDADKSYPFVKEISNQIFVVQRFFHLAINLHKSNPSNVYVLWCHDHITGSHHDGVYGEYNKHIVREYFCNNNLNIVAVSEYHKELLIKTFTSIRVTRIYNGLFRNYIKPQPNVNRNKYQLLYASSWAKGIKQALEIGKASYEADNKFRLVLICPDYCKPWDIDKNIYPFVEIKNCIKDKNEYCRLIQESLCVLGTTFSETFGCVFAEALYLKTPVICNKDVKCGSQEIVNTNYQVSFRNPKQVYEVINRMHNSNPLVTLNNQFLDSHVICDWKRYLNRL